MLVTVNKVKVTLWRTLVTVKTLALWCMLVTLYKLEYTSWKTLVTFTWSLNSVITNFSLKHMTPCGSLASQVTSRLYASWVRKDELFAKKLLQVRFWSTDQKQEKEKTTQAIANLFALRANAKKKPFSVLIIVLISYAILVRWRKYILTIGLPCEWD